MICHNGKIPVSGHYTAVSSGIKYDDEKLSKMTYTDMPGEDIYMLFYIRNKK